MFVCCGCNKPLHLDLWVMGCGCGGLWGYWGLMCGKMGMEE